MTRHWLSSAIGCLVAVSSVCAQSTQPASDGARAGGGLAQPVVADAPIAPEGSDVHPDIMAPTPQPGGAFWFGAEYLLWKVNGSSVPVLVGRIPPAEAEFIQAFPSSNITPLFGGSASSISYDVQSGLRLETGLWLDNARQFGVSVGFFQLQQGQQRYSADSQGQQALGPVFFYDSALSEAAVVLEGASGLREGTVSVDANQHLWGTEINALHSLSAAGIFEHIELLAGFRYLQFSEGLQISGTSHVIPGGVLPCGCHSQHTIDGTVDPSDPTPTAAELSYYDNFGVHNQFYAPQIGLSGGASYSGFFFEATGKIGLGVVHIDAKGEGATTQQLATGSVTQAGGVLVPAAGLAADADRFTFLPEVSLTGGYQIASWCRVTVGYNFLYASEVVRAGTLVGAVDDRQIPQLSTYQANARGAAISPNLQGNSFWAQGLTAGLEFRY